MPRSCALTLMVVLVVAPALGEPQERRAPTLPVAEPAGPPWPADVVATLRTYFERFDVDEVMVDLRRPEVPADPRSYVGSDWLAPFRWTQQAVAFEPYFGSLRGPRGTAMSRSGNALDRALLLAWLYRDRGVDARLVRGTLSWRDAERLALPAGGGSQQPGDPALRFVESTADHWWVEARREADWITLDTVFPGLAPGDAPGRRRAAFPLESLPPELEARIRIEVFAGERPLLQLERTAAELAGGSLRLTALTLQQLALEVPLLPGGEASGPPPGTVAVEAETKPDAVELALPAYPADVAALRLQLPDGVHEIAPLPLEQLAGVRLTVRVKAPMGLPSEVVVPWGTGLGNQLIVRIEPGRVGLDRLGGSAEPVYRGLSGLASAEREAQAAYVERPPDELMTGDVAMPDEPAAAADAEPEALDPESDVVHEPWVALHLAVIEAWSELAGRILDATAVAALAAADLLEPPAGVNRPGVRLLGLHWSPPDRDAGGRITLWLDSPVIVGGGSAMRQELQTAHGLLSSAMLGQVLNRVADRAPVGAFDVTLRAVGAGSRLNWWEGRGPESPPWPEAGVAGARGDLRRGLMVVGPAAPLTVTEPPLLGWWAWERDSGAISGRVLGSLGTAQATVTFGDPVDLRDLDSVLASTAALHGAARWLVLAADSERPEMHDLLPRACAATALVRDLLLAGAPDGWRDPQFASFCGAR